MNEPTKLSPLHNSLAARQAHFVTQAGWQVADHFGDVPGETAVARTHVALIDQSSNGKICVEGDKAGEILDTADLAIGHGQENEHGFVYRLRRDLFFVHTAPGDVDAAAQALAMQAAGATNLITVTNVTHGSAELWLVGPRSAELLSRLCGLDFHPSQFPNAAAKQSSVAKTTQIILRRDVSAQLAYALIGGRSFAAYLWETILIAGNNLGIRPIGQTAVDKLNSSN